jgi:transcriptional regulator with XRE-family HTH domain
MEEMENIWITVQIGANIRKARLEKGLSQYELAELVSASQPQIAGYEQGEKDMPLSRLFDIATAAGVTVAELFGGVT